MALLTRACASAALLLACLWAGPAAAQTPVEAAQQTELLRARALAADQVQLLAYDLVDELVLGWSQAPPFPEPTAVVLAQVTVPAGLGTGLQALVENHLSATLADHPASHLQLVHCPACTAVVVRSGPEGTVLGRGVDDPALLSQLAGEVERQALFLDIEAEGASLVLRARLTRLEPNLPITWSRTISSAAGVPALLRDPTALKTAEQARQEYLATLRGRGPIDIPVRLTVRTYKRPTDGPGTAPPPFIWLQTGVELSPSPARAWTGSLLLGYSFLPQSYQGILAQARVNRLLTGRVRSTTRPDLYAFAGAAVINVWGDAVAAFQDEALSTDDILTAADDEAPRRLFGAAHLGLDLRLGPHIGASGFLELMPEYSGSENLGAYIRIGDIRFQAMGIEVTACF